MALRLSGVLLRVALKHRGSVAAGLCCGLWPADSVGCGDCGDWLALPLEASRGESPVGTFASATAPTRCRETPPAAAAAAASPPRGAARLFKRAHPTRVNQFPSLVARVRQRVGLLLVSRVNESSSSVCAREYGPFAK